MYILQRVHTAKHLINTLHFSFVINDIVLGLFSGIIWDKIKFKLKIIHSIYFDWYCSVLRNWTLYIAQNYNHIKHVFEELLQKRSTNRWRSRRDESLGSRAIFWPFTKPRGNNGGTAPTKGGTTDFWHHSFHATPMGLMLKSRIQGDPVARCPPPPPFHHLSPDVKGWPKTLNSDIIGFDSRQATRWCLHPLTLIGQEKQRRSVPLGHHCVVRSDGWPYISPSALFVPRHAALVFYSGCKGSDAPPLVMWPSLSRVHWFKSRGVLKSCRMAALVVLTPQRRV